MPVLTRSKTSVVWCPSSNNFTLKRSLDAAVLNSAISVALGTDSAMTADGDLIDELRIARRTVSANRLYRMVTTEAASMFKLAGGFGRVSHRGPADLLIVRDGGQTPALTLLENLPQLVIVRGRVQLVSLEIARLCPPEILKPLGPIEVEGRGRYLVCGDVTSLLNQTRTALQQPPRLAGRAIAA
jgi:cytosine/adenosine deaminase-related metal-dependent hydrolase